MGMGYAYVVPESGTDAVLKAIPGSKVVGEVTEKPGAFLGDMEIT